MQVIPHDHILLFVKLEEYFNGIELQVKRIQSHNHTILGGIIKSLFLMRERNTELFLDVHFYFICLGNISKILERICKETKNRRFIRIKTKFDKEFDREIRNHLEHIDARAVGKKLDKTDPDANKWKSDFGNMNGDYYTFGGVKYDISKKSLKKLRSYYEEIVWALHNDLAINDQRFVDQLKMKARAKQQKKKNKSSLKKFYKKWMKVRPLSNF